MRRSGSTALLAITAAASIAGCERESAENVSNAAANEQVALPPLPIAEPPLDRAALLQAVARAASAATLGGADSEAQRKLVGDRFELRIRFGCPGSSRPEPDGAFNVRFEPETRTLRLRAAPDLTMMEPWVSALAGEKVEAVEGFWLPRPWVLAAGCPAVVRTPAVTPQAAQPETNLAAAATNAAAAAAEAPPPALVSPQGVGIAEFFTDMDPRTGRRDRRAYEATKVLPADQQPSRQGYDLVLSGRLTRLADGRVIACRVTSLNAPPDCIISADIDRVRFEQPEDGQVLSEWSVG